MSDKVSVCEGGKGMAPEARRREIPFVAAWLAMGAVRRMDYGGRKDTVGLEFEGERMVVSKEDFDRAERVSAEVERKMCLSRMVSPRQVCDFVRMAGEELDREGDVRARLRGVVMLKDRSGSGYWRMVLPARSMDVSDAYVDVTAVGVDTKSLMEYETVFVQRIHDWESFYVLERLKKAGKRIVYDIDDDIFNMDRDNPAARVIGRDEQMAALSCMKLADCVTTTNEELQERLEAMLEVSPLVVPNAIDVDWWTPTPFTGSPDEWKRIFWQGGDTHGDDWRECIEAVDAVMAERSDVRVVILGFLPPAVLSMLKTQYWKGRVEFLEFMSPETYVQMRKHVRAEVGLAPLRDTLFNRAKSNLKFLEYSAMGMPTVASTVRPYESTIESGNDGFLANDAQGWFEAITTCLDDKRRRSAVLEAARRKVRGGYDVGNVAKAWKSILLP